MWSEYPNQAHVRNQGVPTDWNTTVWDKKNMNLVAFVQNMTTKEVMQVEMISRRTMPTSGAPVLSAISDVTIDEDGSSTVTLSGTDPDGDELTYSAVSDTNAVTVSISSTTLTLTPKADWNGVANITAYTSDGTETDSTTFKLTVTPVDDIASVQDETIDEDNSTDVTLTSTFAGTTTFTAVSDTNGVATTISSSKLTLTPTADWNGVANITAYATDGTYTDSTTFKLTVTPIPDPPGAFAWTDPTSEYDSISVTNSNGGDKFKIAWDKSTDPDGDVVTYKLIVTHPPSSAIGIKGESISSTSREFTYAELIGIWPSNFFTINRLNYKFDIYAYSSNDSVQITGTRQLLVKKDGNLILNQLEFLSPLFYIQTTRIHLILRLK